MTAAVAVVIPTFMRPERTLRAIRSVLRQPGVEAEVVVVDDASPDPFIMPESFARLGVRIVRLSVNGGPAAARNAGVASTTASVIAFLDSDDFFLPGTLAGRMAELHRHDGGCAPLVLAGPVWRWYPDGAAIAYSPVAAHDTATLASGCWYFPGSTALFSRATWSAVGPLDPGLRRLEDLDWGVRLGVAGGRLLVSAEIVAVVEESSPARYSTVAHAAESILSRYGAASPRALDARALRRLRSYLALELASAGHGEGRPGLAAASLARSWLLAPRLSLHLARWWKTRAAGASERQAIAELAQSLQRD